MSAQTPSQPHSGAAQAPQRVLLTGSAGRVGRAIRPYLRDRFALHLFDRVETTDPHPQETVLVGELGNPEQLNQALAGVTGVVHLAATHGHQLTFADSHETNYRGTLELLEAARRAGVQRLVYASSHHVFGLHPRHEFQPHSAALAPDAFYGLGKAFGELASSLYAHRYGIRTLAIRIGNADPEVHDERALRLWTSASDLAQLITLGLTHPELGTFEVAYGGSICPEPIFPDDPVAARLGYRPRDRALDHLAATFLTREAMPNHLGAGFVGGAYAVAPLAELANVEAP